MAQFCKYCGSQIPDGQVCSCPAAQAAQAQQNFQAPQAPQMAPAQPNAVGIFFKKLWSLICSLFKTPATTSQQFVHVCDTNLALALIGIHSLAMALLLIAVTGKINALTGGLVSVFNLPAVFFVALIVAFGLACLRPAVYLLFVKIFRGNTNYKYMLCLSSVKSFWSAPFALLGLVFALLFPLPLVLYFPIIIALLGMPLGLFVSQKALHSGASLEENKAVYALFLTSVVMLVVFYIILKLVVPICVPVLSSGVGNILGNLI